MDDNILEAAINTYSVLIMNENPFDIIDRRNSHFMLDISNYPYISHKNRLRAAKVTMEVFEIYEHYEKCADLQEYINEIKNEIQRLSIKNNK